MAAATAETSPMHLIQNSTAAHDEVPLDHVMLAELMLDSAAGLRKMGPARSLLSEGEADESADLWFGYDVHCRSHPVHRTYGSFSP